MNNVDFNTIDPTQANIPDAAVIQKVHSENDRLPNGEHDKAVKAFLISDGIASGIGKDLAFVDKIPQFINEIIDTKSWECLYVAKGVITPYYCRYIKTTDSENFRAFISAKRPNGLETSVETLDRVLQADIEVQRKFRAIIYQAQEKNRDELGRYKSIPEDSDYPLDESLQSAQQKRIRAANRASVAIPVIGELLDRGLIAIDVAALLGRDIKDPDNLTAEEREYVDKRDLIGLRIDQYIHTNPIPDDEDKEPAYSREFNSFVKDLLGIKDRSKSVRMDSPKKAAEKLLQFYQGDRLKELLDYLNRGLEPPAIVTDQSNQNNRSVNNNNQLTTDQAEPFASSFRVNLPALKPAEDVPVELDTLFDSTDTPNRTDLSSRQDSSNIVELPAETLPESDSKPTTNWELTPDELAERLKLKRRSVVDVSFQKPAEFPEWSKKRDPDGIAWQRSDKKQGRSCLFIPVREPKQEPLEE